MEKPYCRREAYIKEVLEEKKMQREQNAIKCILPAGVSISGVFKTDDSAEGMRAQIFEFVSERDGCSYRDIREWITNRGCTFKGACIENAIDYALGEMVEKKLVARETRSFCPKPGVHENIYRYYVKTGKEL